MKNLIYLSLAYTFCAFFLFQSCCGNRNDEDPIPNQINFTISNDQGNLFLLPNTYTLDSIKIFEENLMEIANYDFIESNGEFYLQFSQGTLISDELSKHTLFVELPNADIDTITFDEIREQEKCGSFSRLEEVSYNGEIFGSGSTFGADFDFIKK